MAVKSFAVLQIESKYLFSWKGGAQSKLILSIFAGYRSMKVRNVIKEEQ